MSGAAVELWPDDGVEGWLAKEAVALTRLCPRSVAICMYARCVRSLQGNDLALDLAGRHQQAPCSIPAWHYRLRGLGAHAPDAGALITMHRSGSSTLETPV